MRVGELVKIKQHYHLQLGQDPVGLVLGSYVNKKNGRQVYEVQLFGATCANPCVEIGLRPFQFVFYGKDLEVFKKLE
tara:strand:+ start:938 stop:1168 length:231 start_codon:yes stop_codon:yes gene_type:complete